MSTAHQSLVDEPRTVSFDECCARIGVSRASGYRALKRGTFPIPELPPIPGVPTRARRYSTTDIAKYLTYAATERRPLRRVR